MGERKVYVPLVRCCSGGINSGCCICHKLKSAAVFNQSCIKNLSRVERNLWRSYIYMEKVRVVKHSTT